MTAVSMSLLPGLLILFFVVPLVAGLVRYRPRGMAQHPVLLFITWTLGLGIGLAVLSALVSGNLLF